MGLVRQRAFSTVRPCADKQMIVDVLEFLLFIVQILPTTSDAGFSWLIQRLSYFGWRFEEELLLLSFGLLFSGMMD